jgi:creatinine amidohydrolase
VADARKARRGVAAILKYVTLVVDEILEAFPPGQVPPTEMVSLRNPDEMEAYLREPLSPGWKSVYGLPELSS